MNFFRIALVLLCAVSLADTTSAVGVVIYVDDDAPSGGNGLTWNSAYAHLQDALSAANTPGSGIDEIHIAQGLYRPDRSTSAPNGTGDRNASFRLRAGLTLVGGFAGLGAPDPEARDVATHPTILSGDLAGNDGPNFSSYADNSLHIIRADNYQGGSAIRGVTIRAANCDVGQPPADQGGGIMVNNAVVQIVECSFLQNRGNFGAGVCCDGAASVVSISQSGFDGNKAIYQGAGVFAPRGALTVSGTVFAANTSNWMGGAMYITTPFALTGCKFKDNTAQFGAGIGLYGTISAATLTDCVFQANQCTNDGAAIYTQNNVILTATRCSFTSNKGHYKGGAVYTQEGTHTYTSCDFRNNSTGQIGDLGVGGAMYNAGSNLTLNECSFTGNFGLVGAVYNSSNTTYRNCTFTGNESEACYEYFSHFTYLGCTFDSNRAWIGNQTHGAAVYAYDHHATGTFRDCTFINNFAEGYGGAILLGGSAAVIVNCDFAGNIATHNGGGVACDFGSPKIVNCRFFRNVGYADGGAIYAYSAGTASIVNCLMVGNISSRGSGLFASSASPTVRNCTIAYNGNGGVGIESPGSPGSVNIANSIIWSNFTMPTETGQFFHPPGTTLTVNHCCVQGWTGLLGGSGNFGFDPLFEYPTGADGIIGTFDDDFRLLGQSPCIDAGANSLLPPDMADADADGNIVELTPIDLDGRVRVADDIHSPDTGSGQAPIVDIGAFEFPPDPCPADVAPLDGDGVVNVIDLQLIIDQWGQCPHTGCSADIDGNKYVDVDDLILLLNGWGPCP